MCPTSGAPNRTSGCWCSGFAGEGVEEQALPAEHGAFVISDLCHDKGLFGVFQELHVGAPSLHETEVDGGGGTKRQKVLEGLEQQWEGGLKVDTVGSQDDIRLELYRFRRQWLAPVGFLSWLATPRRDTIGQEDVTLHVARVADRQDGLGYLSTICGERVGVSR